MENYPYANCILGRAWIPDSDTENWAVYSRKLLYRALKKKGLLEDEIGDFIDFNISPTEGFILLKD